MNRSEHYSVKGWAVAPGGDRVVSGLCLVLDGKVDRTCRVLYGIARPDVAAALHHPEVVASGFAIEVPAGSLTPGSHRLQVVSITDPGTMQVLPQARNVTVY